jgi:KDO2-lipid IV(A) lauroyltransferase
LPLKEYNGSAVIGQIYRPLKNQVFDEFFIKLRGRFHSVGISKNQTLREIIKIRKSGKNLLLGFISDQKPSENNIHYWTTFLNQETAILTGAERIARQADFAVTYLDVRKTKRGHYESTVKVISLDSKNTPEFEITEKYARLMEKTIQREPSYWLWTHNRWKIKREDIK